MEPNRKRAREPGKRKERLREPAFCAKSRFPAPPAKTLICSRSSGHAPICSVRPPQLFAPQQNGNVRALPGPVSEPGRGGKEEMRGNPLLEKRCSAHGDHASVLHRAIPKALGLKMHVGSTPSGPAPPPARTFICLSADHRIFQAPVGCGDPAFRGGTASIEVFANDAVHFAHHILLFYCARQFSCAQVIGGQGSLTPILVAASGRVLKEGAPRTAIMHQRASRYIEGSRSQDACWLHAEWTRTPSGKNSRCLAADRRILRVPSHRLIEDLRMVGRPVVAVYITVVADPCVCLDLSTHTGAPYL
jgi:hypothetical protein